MWCNFCEAIRLKIPKMPTWAGTFVFNKKSGLVLAVHQPVKVESLTVFWKWKAMGFKKP